MGHRTRLGALAAAALAVLGATITANAASAQPLPETARAAVAAASPTDLGPNVKVFDPSMPVAQIKQQVDAITAQQLDDEMGTNRYALLFKPGTYGSAAQPLELQVGYYMDIAGVGKNPTDVTINGRIDVFNRCLPHPTKPGQSYCVALNNFWRSLSNLTINVAGGTTECRRTAMFWAASQASPMRRVNINGPLSLMDYCTDQPQWASGGYIADSKVPAQVTNGSQQQYLVRNSTIGGWSNGVWNQVFSGVVGAPATNFGVPQADGRLHFLADSNAAITKGIVALILLAVQDRTPAEIVALEIEAELARFALRSQLSSNRTQGIPNMIALIRDTAERLA